MQSKLSTRIYKLTISLFIFFFFSQLSLATTNNTPAANKKQKQLSRFNLPRPTSKVTVLLYLSGDNNLSEFMRASLDRVIREGSGEQVQVAAQFDGNQPNDSSRIIIENYKTGENYNTTYVEQHKEYNMGDHNTLIDFVDWGLKNLPSEKVILLVHAHGRGPVNVPVNDGSSFGKKSDKKSLASSSDDHSSSYMNEELLVDGLKRVLNGRKIDLLIYDSCLMGSLEILNMFAPIAHYAIASEYIIYVNANYNLTEERARSILIEKIVQDAKLNPNANVVDYGRNIIANFENSYRDYAWGITPEIIERHPTTLALYDLSQIEEYTLAFANMINKFAFAASKDLNLINKLVNENLKSDYVDSLGYIDSATLFKSLSLILYPQNYAKLSADITALVNKVVIEKSEHNISPDHPISHMSFFFPKATAEKSIAESYFNYYFNLNISKKYKWSSLLTLFWTHKESVLPQVLSDLLISWSIGEDPLVDAANSADLSEYKLFLKFQVEAIKLREKGGYQALADYLKLLKSIKRQSPNLAALIEYVELLMRQN